MKGNRRIIQLFSILILGAFVIQIAGCGTIFYPERRGQTIHGGIDPLIAITDSAWFLAYVIPGFIAWGVDLYTGAIYLPAGQKRLANQPDSMDFVVVKVDPIQLDQKMIEEIVSEHVGQKIDLNADHVQILKFKGADEDEFKTFLSKIDETIK